MTETIVAPKPKMNTFELEYVYVLPNSSVAHHRKDCSAMKSPDLAFEVPMFMEEGTGGVFEIIPKEDGRGWRSCRHCRPRAGGAIPLDTEV
jgi:hypothetical protein